MINIFEKFTNGDYILGNKLIRGDVTKMRD